MAFKDTQNKALAAKLSAKHVKTREKGGITLSYIEGWHAISEANKIFGFDGWDRETVMMDCVWENRKDRRSECSYIARGRVSIRAGDTVICREGSGSGNGVSTTPGEAHEKALKEAETDAMKRALSTFGNPFGLALYDKKQRSVRQTRSRQTGKPVSWIVVGPNGNKISGHKNPIDFCAMMKKHLETISEATEFMMFWKQNQVSVAKLREFLPSLKTEAGKHYGEILGSIYTTRLQKFAEEKAEKELNDGGISKENSNDSQRKNGANSENTGTISDLDAPSRLATKPPPPSNKRIRDKEHLRFVASRSCLICGRSPCHAHHILFAQPRAMSRKVSDELTVPLCFLHHRSLHDHGNEQDWWKQNKVDPIKEAERLWLKTRNFSQTA